MIPIKLVQGLNPISVKKIFPENFSSRKITLYISIVVFISLYTLAGFYICSPLQCFPLISIYNFHISKISLLSFFRYHIFYIFHRLDLFSNSSFPMSSLPASPRYFFQSFSTCLPCPAVITFSSFVICYFTRIFFARCHIPSFPLFLTVSLFSFSNFFTDLYRIFPVRCHLFHSCHVHQLSNPKFSPFLFFFLLLLF